MRSLFVMLVLASGVISCATAKPAIFRDTAPATPADLSNQCDENIGKPHVEHPAENVWVAVGYDLANTILVQTKTGNVIIDVGMSPARAAEAKAALLREAPGATKAIILTHSHIDHTGGASAWVEPGTEIWATAKFRDHFLKQYALFNQAETRRGGSQYGEHVPLDLLPCSALGRRVDIEAAKENGVRFPTHTFSDAATLTVGGVVFEMVEAHGETHDQLFIWLPGTKTLLAGDNFYRAFPNLYTIRGTAPRPVDAWIESIDRMRAFAPEYLVPSHNRPFVGRGEIAKALTDYRDAIQWVRDQTVRGANRGTSIDALADEIHLPAHLAGSPNLRPLYGQVDWSVRAIYTNNLGWFDERPLALYPLSPSAAARKEIEAMGGLVAVKQRAVDAGAHGDYAWAILLTEKLRLSNLLAETASVELDQLRARLYAQQATTVANTNGRGYLLESAYLLQSPGGTPKQAKISREVLQGVPLDLMFGLMPVRLKVAESMDVVESMLFVFPDEKRRFTITVRHGIAEVREGTPLPGTPEPIATLTVDGMTWRELATGQKGAAGAVASGALKIDGSYTGALRFLDRFERDL